MDYVDGFLTAVPVANEEAYRALAAEMAEKFKAKGALQVVECWADDVPDGAVTSFPMAVKRTADEAVVFSWVIWPSRDVRDTAWKSMMEDTDMNRFDSLFDTKRMIYGGFRKIVDL